MDDKSAQAGAGHAAPGKDDAPKQLVLGLSFGINFGFLLQKGGVAKYDVLLGALLLTDFTVMKIMLAAILVGMVGIFGCMRWDWSSCTSNPRSMGPISLADWSSEPGSP